MSTAMPSALKADMVKLNFKVNALLDFRGIAGQ
jgi:hypothetical protein